MNNESSYEIAFLPRNDYLYAKITGLLTAENIMVITRKIKEECIKTNNKVLIDKTESSASVDLSTVFQMGSDILPKIIKRHFNKVAILEKDITDMKKIFEDVSINRSHVIMYFTDPIEAENWLLQY